MIDWQAVAQKQVHPTRIAILEALAEEDMSPVEFAEGRKESLGTISHHFRVLAMNGLIRPTRTAQRRGAIKTWYGLTAKARVSA